jgi:hypothetical protein
MRDRRRGARVGQSYANYQKSVWRKLSVVVWPIPSRCGETRMGNFDLNTVQWLGVVLLTISLSTMVIGLGVEFFKRKRRNDRKNNM